MKPTTIPKGKNSGAAQKNFAVSDNLLAQLFPNPTASAISQAAAKYVYLFRLFTNVKIRKSRMREACEDMVRAFRRIINNKLRYQQLRDNLPAAFGIRFTGFQDLGNGYMTPWLGILCSEPIIIEFIIREWCIVTDQYPTDYSAHFSSAAAAATCKANDLEYKKSKIARRNRYADFIVESYNLSNPYRLQWYLSQQNINAVRFGAVAEVLFANRVHFADTNEIRMPIHMYSISGIIPVEGVRNYQHWGSIKSSNPAEGLLKKKHVPRHRTTNPEHSAAAKRYYILSKMSNMGFSPFVYHHLKFKYEYQENRAAMHQIVNEKYMQTLESCMDALEDALEQIAELKKRLNE